MDALVHEHRIIRKATLRLVPFLCACYITAFLDRVNVGFAALQMQSDLRFSDTVYSFGAGIFFIGYFFFEVPSNVILEKVGARLWIARIMAHLLEHDVRADAGGLLCAPLPAGRG